MTDKSFQKLMDETYSLCVKHRVVLEKLETEYERRFGAKPSDIDDDFFIDSFSYGEAPAKVEDVIAFATELKERRVKK